VKGGLFTSALGHAPSDIVLEGDDFVSPDTSYAPEEVVPGQLFDTLDIKVYTSPESGVPFISENNYRGDGTTTEYYMGEYPGFFGICVGHRRWSNEKNYNRLHYRCSQQKSRLLRLHQELDQ